MSPLFAFCLYWLIFFVVCYMVAEYAQNYLYDETTPMIGLKVGGGTLLLAIVATIFRPSFDTMFTSDLAWTVLQAILWVLTFLLVFRFHPQHALGLGLATMVLVAGMASLAISSLSGQGPAAARTEVRPPAKPLRRPAGPVMPASPPGEAPAGKTEEAAPKP